MSGPQSCHAVGLSMCERTYGDLLSAQRLVRDTTLSCELVMVANLAVRSEGRAIGDLIRLALGGALSDLVESVRLTTPLVASSDGHARAILWRIK